MHEMAIAQGILELALENAAQHEAHIIHKICLRVGKMTGVESEALRFCFQSLAEGTIAAKAVLEIESVPLVGRCRECGRQFDIEAYRFICGYCHSAKVEIVSGRELQVDHLEVD